MASRSVFRSWKEHPYVARVQMEFPRYPGQSKVQKQRSIHALHEAYTSAFPDQRALEISSKSPVELGVQLSAFHLTHYVPALSQWLPVETLYQASKVRKLGGPYPRLLTLSARQAKQESKAYESDGAIIGYQLAGIAYPLKPYSLFYDYLYLNALLDHPELAEQLLSYDAFTDIEFNDKKSVNCQAHAAALYVSLARAGLLEEVQEFDRFQALMTSTPTFITDHLTYTAK